MGGVQGAVGSQEYNYLAGGWLRRRQEKTAPTFCALVLHLPFPSSCTWALEVNELVPRTFCALVLHEEEDPRAPLKQAPHVHTCT